MARSLYVLSSNNKKVTQLNGLYSVGGFNSSWLMLLHRFELFSQDLWKETEIGGRVGLYPGPICINKCLNNRFGLGMEQIWPWRRFAECLGQLQLVVVHQLGINDNQQPGPMRHPECFQNRPSTCMADD